MFINTEVVRALMSLRRIDEATLANIANVSAPILTRWLHDSSEAAEELIAFDTQLEILRILGINGETPRNDIVHYWYIHEALWSRSSSNYWALSVLTSAFGKADAVYFAKEADPAVSTRSKAHFGLQFPSFKAVLEVTSHPLRNVGFDPKLMRDLQWAPGNFGVLVDQSNFERLAPGLMTPTVFEGQLNIGREQSAWERLNLLARDAGIGANQIEKLLLSVQKDLQTPKLTKAEATQQVAETYAEPVEVTAPVVAPVVAPAPRPPKPAPAQDPEVATPQVPPPAPAPVQARPVPRPAPVVADDEFEQAASDNVAAAHGLLRSSGDARPRRPQGPRQRGHMGGAPRSPYGSGPVHGTGGNHE